MHKIFALYLSDAEIVNCCSDEKFIRKMLQVEIALAKVQAALDVIPKKSAQEITAKLKNFQPDPASFQASTLQNGIPTIALLGMAKKQLTAKAADHLHWGATSQDIIDSAHILIVSDVLKIFKKRISTLIKNMKKLSKKHQGIITIARSRTQQAVPISYAQKIDAWWGPLERHLARLKELEPRLLVVQLGGAGGNLSALGKKGIVVRQSLAKELKLNEAGVWQNQRDHLAEFANWLSLVAGTLGKMASDILLLSQTEIGEIIENSASGGKSSSMPHKNNPVLSEAIVALSKYVMQLAGTSFQSLIHQHERDGAAWILEWLSYPQMMIATGTILNHAISISRTLSINKDAVQLNLEKSNGRIYSEQANFALSQHMNRAEARKLVTEACGMVVKDNIHLAEALKRLLPDLDIDWESAFKL